MVPQVPPLPRNYLLDSLPNQVHAPGNVDDASLFTGKPRGRIYSLDGVGDEKWGFVRMLGEMLGEMFRGNGRAPPTVNLSYYRLDSTLGLEEWFYGLGEVLLLGHPDHQDVLL